MNFGLFTLYTVAGSALWNGIWLGLGFAFGPAIRPVLERWSGVLSTAVVVIMVGVVVWFLAGRLLRARKEPPSL